MDYQVCLYHSFTTLNILDVEVVWQNVQDDPKLWQIIKDFQKDEQSRLYKDRLVLLETSSLIHTVLHTYPDLVVDRHSEFLHTYKRLMGELYWPSMKSIVQ